MSPPLRTIPRSNRAGYALLLVLVALVIVTSLLVRLSSQALRENTSSLLAQRELRLKWGAISCERAALSRADAYFSAWEAERRSRDESAPPGLANASGLALVRQQIQLGECQFNLVIADEDAKIQLPTSQRENALQQGLALRKVVPAKYVTQLRLAPRFESLSWGEVFDLEQMQIQHGTLRVLPEATRNVSLWGSGKLNIHRASGEVMRQIASTVVPNGRADRLIETLRDSPNMNVETLLQKSIKNEQERAQLDTLLGDNSMAYSAWVEGSSPDGQYQLSYRVRRIDENGLVLTRRFLIE